MNVTETGRPSASPVPRMRYIDAAVAMLKASDPETPVTVYMIRQLVAAGNNLTELKDAKLSLKNHGNGDGWAGKEEGDVTLTLGNAVAPDPKETDRPAVTVPKNVTHATLVITSPVLVGENFKTGATADNGKTTDVTISGSSKLLIVDTVEISGSLTISTDACIGSNITVGGSFELSNGCSVYIGNSSSHPTLLASEIKGVILPEGYSIKPIPHRSAAQYTIYKDGETEPYTGPILLTSKAPDVPIGGGTSSYILGFETNGGSAIGAISRASGTVVDLSAYKPTREGYVFAGWYSDKELTAKVSSVTLTRDTTVYAKWTAKSSFTDVPDDSYYKEAVDWAVDKGVTGGKTATTFDPNGVCTRAQAVTFLWRAMGSPAPTTTDNPFADVSADAYYYKAVLWAVEKGITAGTSTTTFSPEDAVTRAQAVAFLWRTAGKPVVNYAMDFTDVPADAYYTEAVRWAVSKGITSGMAAHTFAPADGCTRAQIVALLWRAHSK